MSARATHAAGVAFGGLLVVLGGWTASRRMPAAAAETPIPAVVAALPSASASTTLPDVEQVAVRLTELVGSATLEPAKMPRGYDVLEQHWRRMQAPWVSGRASNERGKLVQLVALRTSEREEIHTIKTSSGRVFTFDARTWNMSEGAFSQREALVAPAGTTWRFHLRVEPGSMLDIAPAVLGLGDALVGGAAADVAFSVRAEAETGESIELASTVIDEGARNRWKETRIDLAKLAGREVELALSVVAACKPAFRCDGGPAVVGFWGTPQIVRRSRAALPYSVLWIVIDALRPDVVASFHDDAFDQARRSAPHPPNYAVLPKIEGLTPNIDALAKRSTIFRRAYSSAPWTRPGTIGMLSGVHGTQLGVSPLPWVLPDTMLDSYYASRPPLLPLTFRRAGAATRAFVNNNFMLGYSQVGLDMGFEEVDDYRFRTADTAHVLDAALASMRAHAGERTFTFVNFNSPHDPYDPTPECLDRIPPAAKHGTTPAEYAVAGPRDNGVRAYMAEACKDDAAVGALMAELDRQAAREGTIVVLTADHGETMSERHEMRALDLDDVNTRFHHAFGHFEETTRIPILVSLPGVFPEGAKIDARVTSLDIAPTIAAIEGMPRDARQHGWDLLSVARGSVPPERAIITLGRASAAIMWGKWRYVERDEPAQRVLRGRGDEAKESKITRELFDLESDPGETENLAEKPAHRAASEEMQRRLSLALADLRASSGPTASVSGPAGDARSETPAKISIRFAGAAGKHTVKVGIEASGAKTFDVLPIGLSGSALRKSATRVDVDATTLVDGLVGLDLTIDPPLADVRWTVSIDGRPIDDTLAFAGALGVTAEGLSHGIVTSSQREATAAAGLPFIDPALDLGMFVVRQGVGGEAGVPERVKGGAANAEIQSALRQWGYAK